MLISAIFRFFFNVSIAPVVSAHLFHFDFKQLSFQIIKTERGFGDPSRSTNPSKREDYVRISLTAVLPAFGDA
jgi:hypothetical protein